MGFGWRPLTAAAAVAVLIVAAFVAGRLWPQGAPAAPTTVVSVDPNEAGARVRLAAISDHLDRSERVLLDLVNAEGQTVDLTDQQMWAADLIDSNRLYREAATRAGDTLVANVLDDLERSLLEIVHGPSMPMPAELDEVRAASTRRRCCSRSASSPMNSTSAKSRPCKHGRQQHEHCDDQTGVGYRVHGMAVGWSAVGGRSGGRRTAAGSAPAGSRAQGGAGPAACASATAPVGSAAPGAAVRP